MATAKTNEEIKDFDKPKVESNDMMLFMKRYNKNEILLAGTVKETEVSEPTAKIDRKTNLPILDADGNPQFYEPFYSAQISFEGGMLRVNLSKSNYEKLVVGNRFLFVGSYGQAFGKVAPVFHDVTEI